MSHYRVLWSYKRGGFGTKKFGLAKMCRNIEGVT